MNTMHRSLALLWIPAFVLACASAACNQDVYTSSDSGTDSDGETDGGDTDVVTGGADEPVDVPDPNPNANAPGDPQIILRIDDTPPKPIALSVDKTTALELFAERAHDITLIEIDSTKMLTNALEEIRDACGEGWKLNTSDPVRDCGSTPLGQRFPEDWKSSSEFSLVRLLTLTPANANMIGTELEGLQTLVNENPDWFEGGFGEILRDTLLMTGVTDPLLPMEAVVESAKHTLLASHPNIQNTSGVLTVTLWDALHDMTPLQEPERFGPSGGHPGVLMPDSEDNPDDFVTSSDALLNNFSMRIETGTRHKRVDGVDLSAMSGGDMFIVPADEQGEPALAFNFDSVEIKGIAANPTINMRLRIQESFNTITACTNGASCYDNAPCPFDDPQCGTVEPGTIWDEDLWVFEYFAAWAGRLHYQASLAEGSYKCFGYYQGECLAGALIGTPDNIPDGETGSPIGWTKFVFGELLNLDVLNPPEPQYFWELLVSIADHAFHDPDGDGVTVDMPAPVFQFEELGLGITADELVNGADLDGDGEIDQLGVIDWLRAQEDVLSDIMVGRYWMNNAPLDFYFMKEGEQTYLVFANEEDLRADPDEPNQVYAPDYPVPGFFNCRNLLESCKLSKTNIPGVTDTTHEKLALQPGATTLYVRDDVGADFELGVFKSAHGDEVWIDITKL